MKISFHKQLGYAEGSIKISSGDKGETQYTGINKVEAQILPFMNELVKISRDLWNFKSLLPRTEIGDADVAHTWVWKNPIEVGYPSVGRFSRDNRALPGNKFTVKGVRVTTTGFFLITEPDEDISIGISTEDCNSEEIPVTPIEFTTYLHNSNTKEDAKTVDPAHLVVGTQCGNNALNITVLNKYGQAVGAVEVENLDGQIQVLVWNTDSVLCGGMPSDVVKPTITFSHFPGEPYFDTSTNPIF